jgi:phosphatidylserine decarboxylase
MIAKEGLIFIWIGVAFTAGFLFTSIKYDSKLLFSLAIIFCLLTLFTTFFFRDPDRQIPTGKNIFVSPADGKVIGIEKVENDYIGQPAIKVSIFLSVFDVHVNRISIEGVVDYIKFNQGKFFAAFEEKSSNLNENNEIGIITQSGQKYIIKQIAGLIARRIVCNINEGDTVTTGSRFGLIRFGSRTELIVPESANIEVKLGQHVYGGETIIGHLPEDISTEYDTVENRGNDVEL